MGDDEVEEVGRGQIMKDAASTIRNLKVTLKARG